MITDMLQWPHRIVVPLGGVDVDIRPVSHFTLQSKLMSWKLARVASG